jgi:hypothetical protein
LGIDPSDGPSVIYLEQQQKELSACVIGANPSAVAKAYRAGILTSDDMEHFWPEISRQHNRSTRSYSFGSFPMSRRPFADKFKTEVNRILRRS